MAANQDALANGEFITTRIADRTVLIDGLEEAGFTIIKASDNRVVVLRNGHDTEFLFVQDRFIVPPNGVRGGDEKDFQAVADLEHAVGRIMQRKAMGSVQEQARNMGLKLIQQENLDGTIQLVFEGM